MQSNPVCEADEVSELAGVRALPTVVVGGYLGAGKTTLVNHLLRHAGGRRIAVMVNDFGEIGIDADLIESRDGDVINLAGGCICCSVGSDLMEALRALTARTPRPDLVLIETSGVALPGAVAAAAGLARGMALEATVVVIDARTVRERSRDRYVGDIVLRQLEQAQLVLVNKIDQVDAPTRDQVLDWISQTAPQAACVQTERSAVPLELLFSAAMPDRPPGLPPSLSPLNLSPLNLSPLNPAAERFVAATLRLNRPVDPESLARALAAPGAGLVRAKGFVRDAAHQWFSVQVVGATHEVMPVREPPSRQDPSDLGYLVGIGLRDQFDPKRFDLDSLGLSS